MRAARLAFAGPRRAEETEAVLAAIRSLDAFKDACRVALYSPDWGEIDVSPLFAEKTVLLPRCTDRHTIEFAYVSGMRPGIYGNDEPWGGDAVHPSEIDLMIVPGLAFSPGMERLGMGAGCYDRYLKSEGRSCPVIGVGFSFQLTDGLPSNEDDVKMDYIICGGSIIGIQ